MEAIATSRPDADQIKSLYEQRTRELAELVRNYCRNQANVWQEVPYWAHQDNGRTGWSRGYTLASMDGYWDIYGAGRGLHYLLVVDLATGEIQYGKGPAMESRVAALASNIDLLDATAIVERLMRDSQEPLASWAAIKTEEALKAQQGPAPARPFVRA